MLVLGDYKGEITLKIPTNTYSLTNGIRLIRFCGYAPDPLSSIALVEKTFSSLLLALRDVTRACWGDGSETQRTSVCVCMCECVWVCFCELEWGRLRKCLSVLIPDVLLFFFFWLLPLGVIAVVHLLQSHLIMYVTPTLCLSFTAFMHPLFGLLWSFPHFWQLHLQHPSSIISTMPPVHMSKLSPHCLSNVCSLVRFPDVPPRGNRFFLKPRRIGMFSCAHCGHHTGVTVTNKWLNPILITASITSSQYISTHFPCK